MKLPTSNQPIRRRTAEADSPSAQAHYRKGDLAKGDALLKTSLQTAGATQSRPRKSDRKVQEDAKKAGKNDADITKAKDLVKKGLEEKSPGSGGGG